MPQRIRATLLLVSLFWLSSLASGQDRAATKTPSGPARKLTSLNGAVSQLRWSPDGKQIGFLYIDHPPRQAGPTAAVPPETGVIGDKVFEQRLGSVDVTGGQTRLLTPDDLYVY